LWQGIVRRDSVKFEANLEHKNNFAGLRITQCIGISQLIVLFYIPMSQFQNGLALISFPNFEAINIL